MGKVEGRAKSKKRPDYPALFAVEYRITFSCSPSFFLQIVDIGATMLEVLVAHNAHLQLNDWLFDAIDDQFPAARFFMRAIATSRLSP